MVSKHANSSLLVRACLLVSMLPVPCSTHAMDYPTDLWEAENLQGGRVEDSSASLRAAQRRVLFKLNGAPIYLESKVSLTVAERARFKSLVRSLTELQTTEFHTKIAWCNAVSALASRLDAKTYYDDAAHCARALVAWNPQPVSRAPALLNGSISVCRTERADRYSDGRQNCRSGLVLNFTTHFDSVTKQVRRPDVWAEFSFDENSFKQMFLYPTLVLVK